jgi:hypothetical protein
MATSSEDAESDLAETVQALLSLTLDDVRLLSDRAIADAAGLLARHAARSAAATPPAGAGGAAVPAEHNGGPACALALLDAARGGEESLMLADERVRLLLEAGRNT